MHAKSAGGGAARRGFGLQIKNYTNEYLRVENRAW
jgi:hypothetical protein